MGAPAAGSVVLLPFPFSDLSRSKLRPAVTLAMTSHNDFVLCQVTSNPYADQDAVMLTEGSFDVGSLRLDSYARPRKLFTANEELFEGIIGELKEEVRDEIVEQVVTLLRAGQSKQR